MIGSLIHTMLILEKKIPCKDPAQGNACFYDNLEDSYKTLQDNAIYLVDSL